MPNSVIRTFFWNSLFPCDTMSVGLMKYSQNLPGNSQRYVQYLSQSQSTFHIRRSMTTSDRKNPLRIWVNQLSWHSSKDCSSPPVYQPPPPHSQVNTRCQVRQNESIGSVHTIRGVCKCHVLSGRRQLTPVYILERLSYSINPFFGKKS